MDIRRNPLLRPYDSEKEAEEVAKTLSFSTKIVRFGDQQQVWIVPMSEWEIRKAQEEAKG